MKRRFRLFGLLAGLGIIAALFVVPYMRELLGDALLEQVEELGLNESSLSTLIVVQSALMYTVFALIGVLVYRRAGYSMPVFEDLLGTEGKAEVNWKPWLVFSLGGGLLVGLLVILGDYLFLQLGSPLSLLESQLPAWWKGILGAFSAGIGEELMFRLFMMTLLTLLMTRIFKARRVAIWVSIIFVAVFFGVLHLPATAAVAELSPLVVLRALLLNGIGGAAFGWLYWKQGLESAMAAHFVTDVVVHGLLQLLV